MEELLGGINMIYYNERDIEIPLLLTFIRERIHNIQSLLDVGCHYTHYYYARELRKLLKSKIYDGIDMKADTITASILDNYFVGNVLNSPLKQYDTICCISSIEHSGIIYKVQNYIKEREEIIKKMLKISKQYLFITFPYGEEGIIEGEYANITDGELKVFEQYMIQFRLKYITKFFSREFSPYSWIEIERNSASSIPVIKEKGVSCIAVIEAEKSDIPKKQNV